MTEEERFKTKAGGDPMDCAFHSMHYIMSGFYMKNDISEQGLEDNYNDYRNACYTGEDKDWANEKGLQGINLDNKGLYWINKVLDEEYDSDDVSYSATYKSKENGELIFPDTTSTASNDQYIAIVGTKTDSHAVTFLRKGTSSDGEFEGKILVMDSQRGGKQYWYSPDDFLGAVDIHKTISTTLPTTTSPTTTGLPTTTGI